MKSSVDSQGHQDLVHAGGDMQRENPTSGFGVMDQEEEILLDNDQDHDHHDHHQDLLDVNEASIFYSEFPPLPDFPCMSSSSSSSSTPAPVKAITSSSSCSSASSSSSAASWAVLKSDAEEDVDKNNHHLYYNNHEQETTPAALSSTASMDFSEQPGADNTEINCMDMMETFGYMDLLETNEFFDPSSIFQNDSVVENNFHEDLLIPQEENEEVMMVKDSRNDEMMMMIENDIQEENNKEPDDMAMVFLEWLRSNRETVSAEDLRSVKIKKSTIESAARRLGGGKEGMKQLLKLVLEWVQTNHLQKRRIKETSPFQGTASTSNNQYQDPNPNPNNLNSNSFTQESNNPNCFTHSPWTYDPAPTIMVPPPAYPSSMIGFMGVDPFVNGTSSNTTGHLYQTTEYNSNNMIDSTQTWPSSQFALASPYTSFPDSNSLQTTPSPHAQAFSGYGSQFPYQYYHHEGDQGFVRLGSSATKEARKKRMARQRRLLSHHRHHHHHHHHHHNNHHHNHNNHHQNQTHVDHQHARLNGTTDNNCTSMAPAQPSPGNWVYWPSTAAAGVPSQPPLLPGIAAEALPLVPVDRQQSPAQNNYQAGRVSSERRQVGLSFLLFLNLA